MLVQLTPLDYFAFSRLDASLDNIEAMLSLKQFADFEITKNAKQKSVVGFEDNPPELIAHFVKTNGGTIMLTNMKDGWISLFDSITSYLKTNGCHVLMSSGRIKSYLFSVDSRMIEGPYGYVKCVENGVGKQVCYTTVEEDKVILYENEKRLVVKEAKQGTGKTSKELLLTYCNESGILRANKLDVGTTQNRRIRCSLRPSMPSAAQL
jgi:hypothetical protein